MQITRCPKGHFYDADKCPTCPVCASGETVDTTDLPGEPFETPPVCFPPRPIDMDTDLMFREMGSTVRLEGIASITYCRLVGFLVTPEDENLVQLNGKPLRNRILLREDDDDELTIRGTRVILRPYMEAYRRTY